MTSNFANTSYFSYHDFSARNSINTLLLSATEDYLKKITKETFMGKHVKRILYFSFFFSLKIYCQTVQRQNARVSQLQIKMSSFFNTRLHIQ